MVEQRFLGVRLPFEVLRLVEETAREEGKDKSSAARDLIVLGRKRLRELRAIELFRQGQIATDKAAEIAGLTVNEAMSMLAGAGLRSDETIAEYRNSLSLLLKHQKEK
ncbi:UPF0175 family protein [Candidatus Woesearchaeota archaeon]|nr:UPF0175 family protein [Candidatus Woesearchaeota archaeon]